MRPRLLLAGGACLALAGCAGVPATYVSDSDPLISICQQPVIGNLGVLTQSVDNANNTDPSGMGYKGQVMTSDQITALKSAATSLNSYSVTVAGSHPAVARSFANEANEFTTAASAPNGLTTNTVAVATDKYGKQIENACGSLTIGTAPKGYKPGPGIWDWSLFWSVLGGYIFMIFAGSWLIAIGERSKPKGFRLSPAGVFWLSLAWWAALVIFAGRIYAQLIESATKTPDEKKDERIKSLTKLTQDTQAELDRVNAQIAKDES